MALMKWLLRHLLRYLALLPVLFLIVLYLQQSPDVGTDAYFSAIGSSAWAVLSNSAFLITAGIGLLLVFLRGMTLVWNSLFCCTTILLLLEITLASGIGTTILPSSLWTIPGAEIVPQIPDKYAVPMNLIPLFWVLGAVCTNAFRSISAACCINFILWLLLSYACHGLAQLWENMNSPYQPEMLDQFKNMRWVTAILPALFMFLYTFFLAVFEALIPRQLIDKKSEKHEQKAAPTEAV